MLISEIPQRYAKALLELTKARGYQQKTLEDLSALSSALELNPEIKLFIENPIISSKEKGIKIINSINSLNPNPELISLIELLSKKNRLSYLSQVAIAFQQAIDNEEGTTRGSVRSAQALSAATKKDLESKITKILNKKIVLTYIEDPSLLGGMVAQVGGWNFDDSIEKHLKRMSDELNRRAN